MLSWALLSPDPFARVRGGPLGWVKTVNDLILHCGAFCVLSTIVFSFSFRLLRTIPLTIIVSVVTYAFATELLQSAVPGRTTDPADALANFFGILTGLAVVHGSILFSRQTIQD